MALRRMVECDEIGTGQGSLVRDVLFDGQRSAAAQVQRAQTLADVWNE